MNMMSGKDDKQFGNFDNIKKQMLEQKEKAEAVKGSAPQPTQTLSLEPELQKETQQGENFTICIAPPKAKVEKKAVNYYLSKNLIKRIERGAKNFGYKDKSSVFLEEVMTQVLDNMGIK